MADTVWSQADPEMAGMTPAARKTWWLLRAEKVHLEHQIVRLTASSYAPDLIDSLVERRERRIDRCTVLMEMLTEGAE